jgi:hypothetical protein
MIEVLKQMVEALEWCHGGEPIGTAEAIKAGKQAIKELESQEPVAWQVHPFDYGIGHKGVYARTDRPEQVELWKRKGWNVQPLHTYTPPPQRKPLTDEIVGLLKEARKIIRASSSRNLVKDWDERTTKAIAAYSIKE